MSGMFTRICLLLSVLAMLCGPIAASTAVAQEGPRAAPTATIEVQSLPVAEEPVPAFDPAKATNAYLAQISGPQRARSDAYYEGGYVLLLVGTAYALIVAGLLLWLRISARMRDFAQAITRIRFWQAAIYAALFFVVIVVATLPLTLYQSFYREHEFGLSNQTIGQWFTDFAVLCAIGFVATTILVTVIYAVVRAAPNRWPIWASAITIAFAAFVGLISPVYVAPLFNTYTPLPDSPVKQSILAMAKANGVPVDNVYTFDASRQSDRISANVSGLFGTTRISLTDNLMKRATPAEVEAVLGHEIGHYVLGHTYTGLLWIALVIVVGFWFLNFSFRFLTAIFGGNWDVRQIDDPAGLPVLYAVGMVYLLLATPALNTISRNIEAQADIFGLNAARQPDGFATIALKLSEYRKLDPTPLEEFVFYDHPSGRSRIAMAMQWKAQHLRDPDIRKGPVSPQ